MKYNIVAIKNHDGASLSITPMVNGKWDKCENIKLSDHEALTIARDLLWSIQINRSE